MSSESLRASTAKYAAFNNAVSPPTTPAERIRGHLRAARLDLDRCDSYPMESPGLRALHSAVASMLAALEVQS